MPTTDDADKHDETQNRTERERNFKVRGIKIAIVVIIISIILCLIMLTNVYPNVQLI